MPDSITTAFVQQYKDNIRILFQQEGSKLREAVMMEDLQGEIRYFERIAAVAAQLRTTRHGDTVGADLEVIHITLIMGVGDVDHFEVRAYVVDRHVDIVQLLRILCAFSRISWKRHFVSPR